MPTTFLFQVAHSRYSRPSAMFRIRMSRKPHDTLTMTTSFQWRALAIWSMAGKRCDAWKSPTRATTTRLVLSPYTHAVFGVVIRSQARQRWVHRLSRSMAGPAAATFAMPAADAVNRTMATRNESDAGENRRLAKVCTGVPLDVRGRSGPIRP